MGRRRNYLALQDFECFRVPEEVGHAIQPCIGPLPKVSESEKSVLFAFTDDTGFAVSLKQEKIR
jgi:hypothetical protein